VKHLRRSAIFALFSLGLFLFAAAHPLLCAAQQGAPAISSTPATQQGYTLSPEKLAKARTLGRIRPLMHFGGEIWGLCIFALLLSTRLAARMEEYTTHLTHRRWLQGLFFFLLLIFALTVANLPLDLIGHAIGTHYGISVQGWLSWLSDMGKALTLSLLIGAPLLLLFHWLVLRSPRRYWLWAWLITLPLMVAGACAEPLLEPLFFHFEPLSKSHPALVTKLEAVAAKTGTQIPPDRILLMQASVKTNALNAYVSGLGATKRVVVWDTTAGRIHDDEILFIFGHESGHYVLRHVLKGLLISAVFLLPFYWVCALATNGFAHRWGARCGAGELSSRAGFVLLLFVVSLAQILLEPVDSAFSRHMEHQADVFGQEAIHGIVANPQQTAVSAFNHLGEAVLDDPDPNAFVEFWSYNHPSTQHRARFAAQYNPWTPRGKPKFFTEQGHRD